MSDIEFYEKWCEYNENNLPISFAEFCYKQGKSDGAREFAEKIKSEIEKWWYRSELDMGSDNVNSLIDYALVEWQKELTKE